MAFKKKVINETPSTENTEVQETSTNDAVTTTTSNINSLAKLAKDMEKKARKLRKVTVHYNDPRDSHLITTAYATCENQYFAMAKTVPLDMTVELEQGLCDTLAEAQIQVQVPDGKDTGNMTSRLIKKYSIIYED